MAPRSGIRSGKERKMNYKSDFLLVISWLLIITIAVNFVSLKLTKINDKMDRIIEIMEQEMAGR